MRKEVRGQAPSLAFRSFVLDSWTPLLWRESPEDGYCFGPELSRDLLLTDASSVIAGGGMCFRTACFAIQYCRQRGCTYSTVSID